MYDPTNNRMIIFGGCGGGCLPVLNDVWVLTNANGLGGTPQWIQLFPTGGPPAPRHALAAGYDPASNRMVIFAGHNGGGFGGTTYSDVWVLSNANGLGGTPAWTQLSPTGGPPPGQYSPSFVYDAGNNRLVVVGGAAQFTGSPTNATWVLSHANGLGGAPAWTNLIPEGAVASPPPFAFIAEFYDAAHNRMMLVFPSSGGVALWMLANANGLGGSPGWTQLTPTGGPPQGGSGPTLAVYNPTSNRATVLFVPSTNVIATWVLTNANGLMVPFAAFAAKVDINAASSSFDVNSTFTLGEGGSIAPLTQDVSFQLGAYWTRIPAGSFHQTPQGKLVFEGTINGVALAANLTPLGGNSFSFKLEGAGAPNLPTSNPVTLGLTIGNNVGSVQVNADGVGQPRGTLTGTITGSFDSSNILGASFALSNGVTGTIHGAAPGAPGSLTLSNGITAVLTQSVSNGPVTFTFSNGVTGTAPSSNTGGTLTLSNGVQASFTLVNGGTGSVTITSGVGGTFVPFNP